MCLNETKYNPSSTQPLCKVQVNSRVSIKDVDSGETFTFCIVPPDQLDARNGKISILTSLGAALLGEGVGNVVSWQAPSRLRRFEVQSLMATDIM